MVARDAHVLLAGASRELPDSHRARARFGAAVEAGLDRRQRHQFRRQTSAAEDSFHRRAVVLAAQQAFAETLAQALLHAQILRGYRVRRRWLALEHVGDALLFGICRRLACGEAIQRGGVLVLEVVIDIGNFFARWVAVAGQMYHVVNAIDLVAIVNNEIALAVGREDVNPELNVLLNRHGAWKCQLGTGKCARTGHAQQQRAGQCHRGYAPYNPINRRISRRHVPLPRLCNNLHRILGHPKSV